MEQIEENTELKDVAKSNINTDSKIETADDFDAGSKLLKTASNHNLEVFDEGMMFLKVLHFRILKFLNLTEGD